MEEDLQNLQEQIERYESERHEVYEWYSDAHEQYYKWKRSEIKK